MLVSTQLGLSFMTALLSLSYSSGLLVDVICHSASTQRHFLYRLTQLSAVCLTGR
ncbi:hypothetical protein BCR39DRAFT_551908 [Naematelia encephala]|uniref:Uncharacterized protein n=1 Tax=Naematelia encephala TaxID=71784 RepID=A0A1Y2AI34_9TREE|nr:hypothetical protein BCR39DRAFT_551908 [Naematelia encephala]